MGASIAVVPLIDDEGIAKAAGVDLIGAKEVDHLDFAVLRAFENAGHRPSALSRQEAKIHAADPRGGRVQYVETVPTGICVDEAQLIRDLTGCFQNRRAVVTSERSHSNDQHRFRGVLQDVGEGVIAGGDALEQMGVVSQVFVLVGEIRRRPNHTDREAAHPIPFAQPRIDDRRFEPRIGSDEQAGAGRVDPRNGGIEQVG